jgi:hypothetical protein
MPLPHWDEPITGGAIPSILGEADSIKAHCERFVARRAISLDRSGCSWYVPLSLDRASHERVNKSPQARSDGADCGDRCGRTDVLDDVASKSLSK